MLDDSDFMAEDCAAGTTIVREDNSFAIAELPTCDNSCENCCLISATKGHILLIINGGITSSTSMG